MHLVTQILIAVVALLHLYFLALEMFFWDKPLGRRVFNLTPEFAAASKALAANQGLYNGFLAAGLVWGVVAAPPFALSIRVFFLSCAVIAGVFGGATVSRRIVIVQALPAAIALLVVLFFPS